MVFRLVFFLVVYAALFLVPGGLVAALGWKALKPWYQKRKQRRLAERRAHQLLLSTDIEETCFECGQAVDRTQDVYQHAVGWAHPNCLLKVVR